MAGAAGKACAVVLSEGRLLVFRHPTAGVQIVKGTIEPGETAEAAARRELAEESGLGATGARICGRLDQAEGPAWHMVRCTVEGPLPDRWVHRCADDGGLDLAFFWHPLAATATPDWHPPFRHALRWLQDALRQ